MILITVAIKTGILMEASDHLGVKVNVRKSKYMKMDRNELNPVYQSFTVARKSFEMVKEFGYLGALITDTNNIKSELREGTRSGNVSKKNRIPR
jgi:hypothetical protein